MRELRRVTAPGGRVLASTHGVQVYHPSPVDYWRWTHEGLRRLFETNAAWSSLTVEPAAGTASALAMLLGLYVEIALRRTFIARGPVWLLNTAGAALDGGFHDRLHRWRVEAIAAPRVGDRDCPACWPGVGRDTR